MRILVVEDEDDIRVAVATALRGDGFAVDCAADLVEADLAIASNSYDCVVLDRLFPDREPTRRDALHYVRRRRDAGWLVPVLFVSALGRESEIVAGLAYGDYLAKPFAMAELIMRVRAMARPVQAALPARKTCGDLEIDTARRTARRAGVLLTLTPKEFDALDELVTNQGTVVSHRTLTERCWPDPPHENALHQLIAGLRRKLHRPEMIHNIRESGYRIDPA